MSIEPSGFTGVELSSHSAECPVPALFHGSLLSAAAPSRRSTKVIDQSGSTNRNSAPSVALMIPAPTSTTSVLWVIGSDTGWLVLRGRARLSQIPGYPDAPEPYVPTITPR